MNMFFCKKDVKLTHIRKQYHEKKNSLVDLMVGISNKFKSLKVSKEQMKCLKKR
jgi:hypothetical protein